MNLWGKVLAGLRLRWRQLPLGVRGERAAARYLKRRGYVIVARQLRHRLGEIDLIAVHRRTIVFVEVKTRASLEAGDPAEAVNREKQRRLTRLALAYLKQHQLLDCRCRFDVISLIWPPAARRPSIKHIVNAFEAQ